MIKGTTANCKIKSITVTDSTAIITCIIYSLSPAKEHKAFKFYLRDKDKSLTNISENIYWIDRLNNYNTDSINVDVNQYLETQFIIDITNTNKAELDGNKWVRQCNLVLRDLAFSPNTYAWISEDLTLVSKEFEIPTVQDLDIYSDKNYNLFVNFKLDYKSQADFNYNNSNLYTTIKVLSVYTETLLDSVDVDISNTKIETQFLKTFNTPVKIVIELKNSKGQILSSLERNYIPLIRQSVTYIKTPSGIERVLAYYIKDNAIYNEAVIASKSNASTFKLKRLNTVKQESNEKDEVPSLKVNFNNVVVKLPTLQEPLLYLLGKTIFKIKNPNVPLFEESKMTLYINGSAVADSVYENLNFDLSKILSDNSIKSIDLTIELEGKTSNLSKTKTFNKTLYFNFNCSNKLLCSEYLTCSNG